jgi:hypothetical protein
MLKSRNENVFRELEVEGLGGGQKAKVLSRLHGRGGGSCQLSWTEPKGKKLRSDDGNAWLSTFPRSRESNILEANDDELN